MAIALAVLAAFSGSLFLSALLFLNNHGGQDATKRTIIDLEVQKGEGVREIAQKLYDLQAISSQPLFKTYVFLSGSAHRLKPGVYQLELPLSIRSIVRMLVRGPSREVQVTIPEGANIWEVDVLLSNALVIERGSLVRYASQANENLEGYLFPDTYRFFRDSPPEDVVQKMRENFIAKAGPILGNGENAYAQLILASLLEKEVPDYEDMRLVAGVLLKRLEVGMGLQVDATICYIKFKRADSSGANKSNSCYPLEALDFKIDSPYNTYLHRGLPPSPIANPGVRAIEAAKNPVKSRYWYYLSDPETKKTIFSETLDEHRENRVKYLNS